MNGFTYDNPLILPYFFPLIDYGAGANITRLIAVPVLQNGRKPGGQVIGALISNVTEDFAGSSSDARIEVGISGDTDAYFESQALDETVDIGETLWLRNVEATAVDIPAGRTDFTVTFVVATGTPTGIADTTLYIAWY